MIKTLNKVVMFLGFDFVAFLQKPDADEKNDETGY